MTSRGKSNYHKSIDASPYFLSENSAWGQHKKIHRCLDCLARAVLFVQSLATNKVKNSLKVS
jgi:hypothetical protein